MIESGIDTLVLGCTHYPLLLSQIKEICGPEVRLIDPAPASARQTERLATQLSPLPVTSTAPLHRFYATGSSAPLARALTHLEWAHRLLVPKTSLI
jgi:glutamate racemase